MKPLYGKEIVRLMLLVGWKKAGKTGVHYTLEGPDGAKVTVPDLGARPLKSEAVRRILSFAGLEP